jgi:hypothetical protein
MKQKENLFRELSNIELKECYNFHIRYEVHKIMELPLLKIYHKYIDYIGEKGAMAIMVSDLLHEIARRWVTQDECMVF